MAMHRSKYLIDQLINRRLTQEELDEFLAGLHQEAELQAYSDRLEAYFNELLKQNQPPLNTEENVSRLLNEIKFRP
ncbi:aminoacyltransferase [Spirosoma terrae]|uniref:Aminoacyltransferase n=1 Tax=Spirosoma terrae TaxID=1968276 RepID=A0A6L9LA35_9BACT|nr:aminoacyltransferase [Spirosoma terrae]NDU97340.1 aminoacyltransferase [Spirosoma terrae]